jgi:nicotinamidase-related amidase
MTTSHSALLVIDVQQGLFRKSTPIYKADELVDNINCLIERAHKAGVPVFYIQHSDKKGLVMNSDDWQLHPSIHPQMADCIVHKRHGNAFEDTNLDESLKSKHVSSVVVTGLVTHGCVKASCLGAKASGYQVTLVADGHSSFSKEAAEHIEDVHQKLGADDIAIIPTSDVVFN